MLVIDLRWFLFALLAGLLAALATGRWLGHVRAGREARAWGDMGPGLDLAPCGLLILRGQHTCDYANRYARRLLGLAGSGCALPDSPWVELLAADRAAVRGEGAASRYRGVSLAYDVDGHSTRLGLEKRFVRWWVTAVGEADLVFLLDATSQQRAEEAARSLVNDLSHELRTPLATILTHLEVLSLPDVSASTSSQSVSLLKAEARRMGRLVHQMLELGRLETSSEIERRPVDLLRLAEEAVAQIGPLAAERSIAISLSAGTPLPLVLGDGDRLRQVFLNLLDNAVKYSRPGDRVAVVLGQEAQGIRSSVRDTGPGIPAAHLPHLTTRFYRAAPQEVEGSGLGLALVEEILRRHGTHLEVESRTEGDGAGTQVSFVLQPVRGASDDRGGA